EQDRFQDYENRLHDTPSFSPTANSIACANHAWSCSVGSGACRSYQSSGPASCGRRDGCGGRQAARPSSWPTDTRNRATKTSCWLQRPPELNPDDGPLLRGPARVEHHAQAAVDAEPGMPEAGVGVGYFLFTPGGSTTALR